MAKYAYVWLNKYAFFPVSFYEGLKLFLNKKLETSEIKWEMIYQRTRGDILLNISVLGAPSLILPAHPSISPGWMKCHFYGLSDYPMYISVTEMIPP